MRRGLELATEPTRARHLYPLAGALADVGRTDEARRTLEEIQETSAPFFEGATLAVLGEVHEAFDRLEQADWTPLHSYLLRYDPALDRLRRDPRFGELLAEVNRAWSLNPDGSLPDRVHEVFDSGGSD